jgi:hypothetical protein
MPEIVADPPSPACYRLLPTPGFQESQRLGPGPFLPRARDARGRFAKGSSGNPRGRPPRIPNPRRRVPDLAARPLRAAALSDLLRRKPHLLRALAKQLLPPPASIDPAARLGIDLNSLRSAEDCWRVLSTVLEAVAQGEIAPRRSRPHRVSGVTPRLARLARRLGTAGRPGARLSSAGSRRSDPNGAKRAA